MITFFTGHENNQIGKISRTAQNSIENKRNSLKFFTYRLLLSTNEVDRIHFLLGRYRILGSEN